MSDFIKAEKVASTSLGLLLRELTLPALVWRDAAGDFAGARDDTISLRLPAYAPARSRRLRSGDRRTKDGLHQRKVDVTLDTDIYKDVGISDEELELDIAEFGADVLNPVLQGVVLEAEDQVAALMAAATYENQVAFVTSTDDPYDDVAVTAREYLNNAHVPMVGRVIVCGSALESAFLRSTKFNEADKSGTTQTLREAQIGRVAGFDVYTSPAIPSDEAYAFHKTAYAMALRAPKVPAGAPWGASQSYQGLAIRTVRVFDPDEVEDRFIADLWTGVNEVKDHGHYDGDPDTGGKFIPVEDPNNPIRGHTDAWANDAERLVRAVKITVT